MKVTKKMVVLLAAIFLIALTAVFFMNKSVTAKNQRQEEMKSAERMNELPLPEANTEVDPNFLPTIPRMPTTVADNIPIANFPDLDRMPLDDETIELLPANESIASNYKDWYGANAVGANGVGANANTSVDKELYAVEKPLFNQSDRMELVPLDINSEKRRINFY
jgi:hypothetical protein